jgi:hypothetical protein
VLDVDATFFASQDDTRLVAELREVTMDRDLGIDVDLPQVAEMISDHPGLARAMVNLHRRYRDHHCSTGRRHRGKVFRWERQRVDHHAA